MSSAWDYIGLFTGTFLIFASEWRLSKFGEEAADNRKGSRTNVSHCTPTQAVLVVAYFLVVSRLHDDPPSFLSGLGYLLFGFLIVCFVVGADSKSMSKDFHMMFRICAALRTPVLCFIVVPLSFGLRFQRKVRRWRRGICMDTEPSQHEARVQHVIDQVAEWNKAGRQGVMRTARPNWASMSTKLGSNKGAAYKVELHHLDHILSVDDVNLILKCEPAVNMGDITQCLVSRGLALLCHAEMEALTIGGLSMGLGMESNSHNLGWFQESVVEYEIVTAEDPPRVRKITKESNPDLFYALPHSVGTLGFLTSISVKLTKTKPFVRMHYIMTKSAQELQDTMVRLGEADGDVTIAGPGVPTQFLEATVFSKSKAVVQTGEFVDAPNNNDDKVPFNRINLWYKPFYFRHLENLLYAKHDTYNEIIPLEHYYNRFSRSIFWEIEDMIPFANHPLYRFFWGWMGAPDVALIKLFQGPVIRKASVYAHAVQESCMPVRRIVEGLNKFEEWWDIYPLLLFPLRTYDRGKHSGFLHPETKYLAPKDFAVAARPESRTPWGLWVDLAAYGVPKVVREGGTFDAKKVVRDFEDWTRSVGGWTCYYTDIFCTRREYRAMFDHTLWEKARIKLNANDAFPEPWDKVKPEPGIVYLSNEESAEMQAPALEKPQTS